MAASYENWWVAFRHPLDIWEKHPSFLVGEYFFYFTGLLTLRHALRYGGRYPYIWISTVLHGLTVEMVSYVLPDIDNFWHAQSSVMLLGKRLPLHIVLAYPSFLYLAFMAVSRLHLKRWAEPFAMGLAVVLIDVPFDIMGIKLLWWTWHDTDPNIYDRHYWVPWTSYFFHAAFASSFNILFHGSRRLLTSTPDYQADKWPKEIICCIIVGLFSFPLGTLQFIPFYHTLHDNFYIHTEVCTLVLLATYALIAWTSDRSPEKTSRMNQKGWLDELGLHVVLHYTLYFLLALIEKPEDIRSIGLHEKVGDCEAISPVYTALGQVLAKKSFLCVSDYGEGYYNFKCTKEPREGSEWYEICGTPFENHPEYIIVVGVFCSIGLYVYSQMLLHSGRQPVTAPRSRKMKGN